MKYSIDMHLKRYKSALENISKDSNFQDPKNINNIAMYDVFLTFFFLFFPDK